MRRGEAGLVKGYVQIVLHKSFTMAVSVHVYLITCAGWNVVITGSFFKVERQYFL